MPNFSYAILETGGRKRTGSLAANDINHARQNLQRLGVRIIELKPAKASRWTRLEMNRAATAAVTSEYALELASLLKAGAPLRQALDIQASGKSGVSRLARSVKQSVDAGQPLSRSLRDAGDAAGFLAEFVEAGEAGGRIEDMLQKAGAFLKVREDAAKKTRGALAYPAFILALSVLAVAVITLYVAPALAPTLRDAGSDSVILWLADFGEVVKAHQQTILIGVALGLGVIFLLARTPIAKQVGASSIWRMPMLGAIVRDLEVGQSGSVLAALVASGRSFDSALNYAARVSNRIMRAEYTALAASLRNGVPLTIALQKARHLPYEMKRLAALGERSSALPEALAQAADICTARAMRRIDQVSSTIGPVLVIGLGVGISLLLISVLGSLSGLGEGTL